MAATDLYDAALELLAVCAGGLGANAPARQFVSPGLPAMECPMLCIYVPNISHPVTQPTSPPTVIAQRSHFPSMNWATFMVIITRCTTEGRLQRSPTAAQLSADASRHLQDGWILWNTITKAHKKGTLFPDLFREVQLDPAVPLSPQGGQAGWTLSVQTRLSGYDPLV